MRRCWALDANDRPTFAGIRQYIVDMLEKVHHQFGDSQQCSNIASVYVNLTTCPEFTYENQELF